MSAQNGSKAVVVSRNLLEECPRSKHDAFFVLDHIAIHLRNSGKPPVKVGDKIIKTFQRFDSPQETYSTIQKAIRAVSVKWVRKQKTSPAKLQVFRKLRRRVRRVQYKDSVIVYKKSAVQVQRAALPAIYGEGFLRKPVRVHPYRPMDTFLGRHPVKVYRQGSMFDVIDAYCNIPILAGITRRALKQVVEW